MSEEVVQLLFLKDHDRFMEFVTNEDPKVRITGLIGNFDDLVLCEIIRYGIYNRKDRVGPLGDFYQKHVMEIPEERRFAIYRHVADTVENTSYVSTNACCRFVKDHSQMVVSSAVIDYVSLSPITDGDSISRSGG